MDRRIDWSQRSSNWLRCGAISLLVWTATFSCSSSAEAPAVSCWPTCAEHDAGKPPSTAGHDAAVDGGPSCSLDCSEGPDQVVLSCDGEPVERRHCATTDVVVGEATSISVACVAGPYQFSCAAIQCSPDGGELSGDIECFGEGASCTGSWGQGGTSCGVLSSEAGSTSDLLGNDDWVAVLDDLIEQRRTALGCPQPAAHSPFVGDAATALAQLWHREGIRPSQDNAILTAAGVLGRVRWFAGEVEFSSAFTDSGALVDELASVVDPDFACSPASLGIAVAGEPGESRTVVIVLSECQDCADACRKDCSDGGQQPSDNDSKDAG